MPEGAAVATESATRTRISGSGAGPRATPAAPAPTAADPRTRALLALQASAGNAAVAAMLARSAGRTVVQRDPPPATAVLDDARGPYQRALAVIQAASSEELVSIGRQIERALEHQPAASGVRFSLEIGGECIAGFPSERLRDLLASASPSSQRQLERVQEAAALRRREQEFREEAARRAAAVRLHLRELDQPRSSPTAPRRWLVHDAGGTPLSITESQRQDLRAAAIVHIRRLLGASEAWTATAMQTRARVGGAPWNMDIPWPSAPEAAAAAEQQMGSADHGLLEVAFDQAVAAVEQARSDQESAQRVATDARALERVVAGLTFVRNACIAIEGTLVTIASGGTAGALAGAAMGAAAEAEDQLVATGQVQWEPIITGSVVGAVSSVIPARLARFAPAIERLVADRFVRTLNTSALRATLTARTRADVLAAVSRAAPSVSELVVDRLTSATSAGIAAGLQGADAERVIAAAVDEVRPGQVLISALTVGAGHYGRNLRAASASVRTPAEPPRAPVGGGADPTTSAPRHRSVGAAAARPPTRQDARTAAVEQRVDGLVAEVNRLKAALRALPGVAPAVRAELQSALDRSGRAAGDLRRGRWTPRQEGPPGRRRTVVREQGQDFRLDRLVVVEQRVTALRTRIEAGATTAPVRRPPAVLTRRLQELVTEVARLRLRPDVAPALLRALDGTARAAARIERALNAGRGLPVRELLEAERRLADVRARIVTGATTAPPPRLPVDTSTPPDPYVSGRRRRLVAARPELAERFRSADQNFERNRGRGELPSRAFDRAADSLEQAGLRSQLDAALDQVLQPLGARGGLSQQRFDQGVDLVGELAGAVRGRPALLTPAGQEQWATELAAEFHRIEADYRRGLSPAGERLESHLWRSTNGRAPAPNRIDDAVARVRDVIAHQAPPGAAAGVRADNALVNRARTGSPLERLLGLVVMRRRIASLRDEVNAHVRRFEVTVRTGSDPVPSSIAGVNRTRIDVDAHGRVTDGIFRRGYEAVLPAAGELAPPAGAGPRRRPALGGVTPWRTRALAALLQGYERAHLVGPGFGSELVEGIMYAPERVNQRVQNSGVEHFIRTAAAAEGADVALQVSATGSRLLVPRSGGPPHHIDVLERVQYTITVTLGGRERVLVVAFTVGSPPSGAVRVERNDIPAAAPGGDVLGAIFRRQRATAAGTPELRSGSPAP